MLKIGEFSKLSRISIRMLRHYDEIGLVSASGRTEGGFRLYTEENFERLILIRRMKPLGFSLEEMTALLEVIDAMPGSSDDESRALRQKLDGFIQETITRREGLRAQLAMSDEFLRLLQQH